MQCKIREWKREKAYRICVNVWHIVYFCQCCPIAFFYAKQLQCTMVHTAAEFTYYNLRKEKRKSEECTDEGKLHQSAYAKDT